MAVAEFLDLARSCTYARMPVFDAANSRFIGVVNVFVVVSTTSGDDIDKTIAQFARKPLMIQGETPVDDIYPLMRRARQPMCFVTNETGEVTGLITEEDILEEIVGAL